MTLDRSELRSWYQLIQGIRALQAALDRRLRHDAGMSHDDYLVLARLYRAPEKKMTMTQLATEVEFSPSRLSNTMGRFETRGWIVRKAGGGDKRSVEARLTEEGIRLTKKVTDKHLHHVKELVIDTLGPETARQTAEALGRIRKATRDIP